MFQILHDPANGPMPNFLTSVTVVENAFHARQAGSIHKDDRCPRCGRDLHVHIWQAVTDAGVIDCAVTA